jgi:hypothetical protein
MTPRASSDELEVDARDPWSIFVRSIWNAVDGTLNEVGSRFSISPRASVDATAIVDGLEARTELDRGQCQALIAALTPEFAFIQGPPGTGKWYLGVQLTRVLSACKRKARLKPVVVV